MGDRPSWQHRHYGDGTQPIFAETTYEPGLRWLLETCETIEDWGCGMAWARRHVPAGRYKGVDGSPAAGEFADVICDLRDYRSDVDGIFMRHVLEHNRDFPVILGNVMASFRKRFVLVTFTPFGERTRRLNPGGLIDLSFRKSDLTGHFAGCSWREEHYDMPGSQYGVNDVFYLERQP
jgi:hypothetical protein